MSEAIANQLFLVYLGRPADVSWRKSTADLLNNAAPPVALQNAFFSAAVLEGTYSLNDSPSALVNKIFQNIFGFAANGFEQQQWGDLITKGVITAPTAAWTIFNSYLGATNLGALADTYQVPARSKLIAINDYTAELANNGAANVAVSQIGGAAATAARAVISGISSAANAAALKTNITTTVNGATTAATGTTYTLTAGADNIPGTSSNDIITGLVSTTAGNSTLSASDVINGAAGTDTFNITFEGDSTALPGAQISNVEVFNLRAIGNVGKNLDVNASTLSGATQVWTDRSTNDVTVTGLAAGAAAGIRGNGVVDVGNATALTFGYSAGVTAGVLAVDGGVRGAKASVVAKDGLETLTIASTGGANTLAGIDTGTTTVKTVTIAATTNLTTGKITDVAANATISISGLATSVDLGTLAANVKSVDAAGLTAGGVTAVLDAATATFTGGGGNDTVTTAALTTTTAGVINAGAGTDILVLADTTHADTAVEGALYTGFETLRTGVSQDLSLLAGITALQVTTTTADAAIALSKATATQAAAITVRDLEANTTNELSIALADSSGSSDVVSITLQNSTATAAAGVGDLKVVGFETLNVISGNTLASGTANFVTTVDAANTSLRTVNVTGASDFTGSFAGNGGITAINAGAMTGSGIVTLTVAPTGLLAVTGTANSDVVKTTSASLTNNLTVNFGAGSGDTLTITNDGATITDNGFGNVTGIDNLTLTGTGGHNVTLGGFANAAIGAGNRLTVRVEAGDDNTTINAGALTTAAVKIIYENDSAAGKTGTITTGNGNDTITVSAGALSFKDATDIRAGQGNDTINLFANAEAGTDTIRFEVRSINGIDSISNFFGGGDDKAAAGTAGGDVLNFALEEASGSFRGNSSAAVQVVGALNTALADANTAVVRLTGTATAAADAAALNALTFTALAGAAGDKIVLIYGASDTADARIAVATLATGGNDFNDAVDVAVLVGVNRTTAFNLNDFGGLA
jgi:hypothetical protein